MSLLTTEEIIEWLEEYPGYYVEAVTLCAENKERSQTEFLITLIHKKK